MSKTKCPRCKTLLKSNETFCMSCGAQVAKETKNIKEETKINEPTENPTNKDICECNRIKETNQKTLLFPIICVVIVLLLSTIAYLLFFKTEKCKECICPQQEIKYIEKEPTIQYINFQGYRFSIPLDWNFEGNSSEYKFINIEETIYVLVSDLETIDYNTFISEEFRNVYLDTLQTKYDISIKNTREKEQDEKKYYIMEGIRDSYNYNIIITEKESGIFITEVQFESNNVYAEKKQEVINFALSYVKNDNM